MPKIFPFFRARDLRDYVIQVSLIILSILIAAYVGQCQVQRNDQATLAEYLTAIDKEVANELRIVGNNFYDAGQDLTGIRKAISLSKHDHIDSTYAMFHELLVINIRGVFRPFPPSTYDAMLAAGEAELIEDLELRQQLSFAFAFRDGTIREDLNAWDSENKRVFDIITPYLDAEGVLALDSRRALADPAGFRVIAKPLLLSLLRQCQNRRFHLEVSQGQFEILQEMLEARDRSSS